MLLFTQDDLIRIYVDLGFLLLALPPKLRSNNKSFLVSYLIVSLI